MYECSTNENFEPVYQIKIADNFSNACEIFVERYNWNMADFRGRTVFVRDSQDKTVYFEYFVEIVERPMYHANFVCAK